jgi:hypothetical protein
VKLCDSLFMEFDGQRLQQPAAYATALCDFCDGDGFELGFGCNEAGDDETSDFARVRPVGYEGKSRLRRTDQEGLLIEAPRPVRRAVDALLNGYDGEDVGVVHAADFDFGCGHLG